MILFLLGFLCSSVLFLALIVAYYVRARRRVRSITEAIGRYQQSKQTVGAACDAVYGRGKARTIHGEN